MPRSSAAPARSASPSSSSPRSNPPPGEHRQRLVDVGADRLGVDAAEVRVALVVDLRDADPAAGEQPRDPARARAVQRLDEHGDVRRPERVEVQRRPRRTPGSPRTGRTTRRARPPRRPRAAGGRWPAPRCAAIPASIVGSMSAPAAAPVGDLTLNPLSVQGLCDAVITMPAAAPRWTTSYELIWVGTAVPADRDRDVVGEQDLGRGPRRSAPRRTAGRTRSRRPSPGRRARRRARHAVGAAADVLEA